MKFLQGIIVAFQFLTRFYLPINIEWDEKNIKFSLLFFPIVGGAIGGVLYLVARIFAQTNVNISLMILLAWILITGGLHFDGLSDTVDGFSARKNREETLKIMDDSHIGAFGVMAIVLALAFKYYAIANLIGPNPWGIYLAPVFARALAGIFLTYIKTAKDIGLAAYFHSCTKKWPATLAFICTLALAFYFNSWMGIRVLYTTGIICILLIPIYRKLGGLTGDVYGTIVEVFEIIFMTLCII